MTTLIKNNSGFTLIELMVSLVIGFIIILGVYIVFESHNTQTISGYTTQELQANSRSTQFHLTHLLRNAGSGLPQRAALSPINEVNNLGGPTDPNDYSFWDMPAGFFNSGNRDLHPKIGTDGFLALNDDLRCSNLLGDFPWAVDREHFLDNPNAIIDGNNNAPITFNICLPAPNCFSSAPDGGLDASRNQGLRGGELALLLGENGGILTQISSSRQQLPDGITCGNNPFTEVSAIHIPEFNFGLKPDGTLPPPANSIGQNARAYLVSQAHLYYVSTDERLVRLALSSTATPTNLETISDNVEDWQVEYNLATTNGGTTPGVTTCTGSGSNCPYTPFYWQVGPTVALPLPPPPHEPGAIRLVRYQLVLSQRDPGYLGQGQPLEISDHTATAAFGPVNLSQDDKRRRRHQIQVLDQNLQI